jgi:hypothetical protein
MSEDMPKIDKSKIYYCWQCVNQEKIPGDCHINCKKPIQLQGVVNSASEEVRFVVQYAVAKVTAENPNSPKTVIRCVWNGSGLYPYCFDPNTVVACSNFQAGDAKH